MFETNTEINQVYHKADELFNLKIKAQLKGTGLLFEKIMSVKDLLTGEDAYSMVVDKKVITFKNTLELCFGLIKIIEAISKQVESEIKFYEGHKNNDLNPDIATIDYFLDDLYNRDFKLSKLSEKIQLLINKLQNDTQSTI